MLILPLLLVTDFVRTYISRWRLCPTKRRAATKEAQRAQGDRPSFCVLCAFLWLILFRRSDGHLTGARCLSSSNQLMTTWICGAARDPDWVVSAGIKPRSLPSGVM